MKHLQHTLISTLLICSLLAACNPGSSTPQPDCAINDITVAYGDKIPSDECGGCMCSEDGQLKCVQQDCIPQSTYTPDDDNDENDNGWAVSEYYCCCKSGCPPNSQACIAACLVFGGGACSQSYSIMKTACQGSSPIQGCTCPPHNESTVAPQ